MVSSALPEANILPSGLNIIHFKKFECPSRINICFPVSKLHKTIVFYPLSDAKIFPSCLNAIRLPTLFDLFLKILIYLPVKVSQIIILLSSPPDTNIFPSGLNYMLTTYPLCPFKMFFLFYLDISQIIIVSSLLADAIKFPSGLNAIFETELR